MSSLTVALRNILISIGIIFCFIFPNSDLSAKHQTRLEFSTEFNNSETNSTERILFFKVISDISDTTDFCESEEINNFFHFHFTKNKSNLISIALKSTNPVDFHDKNNTHKNSLYDLYCQWKTDIHYIAIA